MIKIKIVILLTFLTACTQSPIRFADRPPVQKIIEIGLSDIPKENEYYPKTNLGRILFTRRLVRFLEFRSPQEALNINSHDEVPDSSWFTNRIGRYDISPQEAARASTVDIEPKLPLTIFKGKSVGSNPGFFAKDASGRRFLIKFDTLENPEMQTATNNIINRIFWTLGYNVPADYLIHFKRQDIIIGKETKKKNELGEKIPMTATDLDDILEKTPHDQNAVYRATASELLKGKPLGGFTAEGIRADDPNDTVPHEHRRELRGLRVFSAWLGHTDIKEDNTLDMLVESDGVKIVKHYFLDFGEALGSHQAEKGRLEDGWEYSIDWENQFKAFLALGLWRRPWEAQKQTPWLSIGAFSDEYFQPELWREVYPYWPFFEATPADDFWAVKKILAFNREILAAIVKTGELSNINAEKYLIDVLLKRRDILARYYLPRVTPLDQFEVHNEKICAIDLMVHHQLINARPFIISHANGDSKIAISSDDSGKLCFTPQKGNYLIYQFSAQKSPPLELHIKNNEKLKILGIIRRY